MINMYDNILHPWRAFHRTHQGFYASSRSSVDITHCGSSSLLASLKAVGLVVPANVSDMQMGLRTPGVPSCHAADQTPVFHHCFFCGPGWRQREKQLLGQWKSGLRFAFLFFFIWLKLRASQVVLVVKNSPANAGDKRDRISVSGSGRSPGGRPGNLLQYPSLENTMDRGAWQATVHGVAKSQTRLK